VLTLTACASPAAAPETTPHGYVEGATEAAEPQLHLAALSASGDVTLLDLLDESTTDLGAVDAATTVTTNGRYVFAATDGAVTIIDSGVWTVDHEDHFHYYRAEPRVVGTVTGAGLPVVSSDTLATTVFFAGSGETVLLDSAGLGRGAIEELGRIPGEPHDGLAVAWGETVLVTTPSSVRALGLDGDERAREECGAPAGTITTRVGVVIGCDFGALLFTADGFERIDYPDGTAPADRATTFSNRAGRPTVAAVAPGGFWLLDTRERTWTRIDSPALLQVAAVDDREGHVVGLASDGRLLVFDAKGTQLAATAPLSAGAQLTVDASRAYVNDPDSGVVFEVDYADGARVAREFDLDAAHLVEVGR